MQVSVKEALSDQLARDRFIHEVNQNFSVIAPAGVGKTTAIVGRILSAINDPVFSEKIATHQAHFVVVTYTNKAAEEMKQRARHELIKRGASSQELALLNKVFFGTIHAFAFQLLKQLGHYVGVSVDLQITTQDDALWFEFLRHTNYLHSLDDKLSFKHLQRFINIGNIIAIARKLPVGNVTINTVDLPPEPDLSAIYTYKVKSAVAQKSVEEAIALAKHWSHAFSSGQNVIGIPMFSKGGKAFVELWASCFLTLWEWVADASLDVVSSVAKHYQAFRVEKGRITYDDILVLANRLFQDPRAQKFIQEQGYSIVLDEAQDTDPEQFQFLLALTHDQSRKYPEPGRFCMVGDPQQSIYSSRADLRVYLENHQNLIQAQALEALEFHVTMRCGRAIVNHANAIFPNLLWARKNPVQVDYVHLDASPWAVDANVSRLQLRAKISEDRLPVAEVERLEAAALATWFKAVGLEDLGIADWHELAVLCPRKSWLSSIAFALESLDIKVQIHSRSDIAGDNPAYAWITGLITAIAEPTNAFEINGVLREVFGLSDAKIAHYVDAFFDEKAIHPLNLLSPSSDNSLVSCILNELAAWREKALSEPLAQAVEYLVQVTKLKERLAFLPDYDTAFLLNPINRVLAKAAVEEENDLSFEAFAKLLQEGFSQSAEDVVQLPGHVQLYTCHKSKGLEWKVVVLPFLFRPISYPVENYPQLIKLSNKELIIAPTPHPAKKSFDNQVEASRVAELERLMYVSVTRPKQRLIYVDDSLFFPKAENSVASILQFDAEGKNRSAWTSLQPIVTDVPDVRLSRPQSVASEKEVSLLTASTALSTTITFPKRLTPSSFVKRREVSASHQDQDPRVYGNWWHSFMQFLPWNVEFALMKTYIEQTKSDAPDPLRAAQEIEIFLESPLFSELKTCLIQTEMPFFAPFKSNVLEGSIDLLAFNSQKNRYTLIDWKTDLDASAEELLRAYKSQVQAYISIFPGLAVDGYIYHTPSGELILV